jgi:hypothetical protein
MSGARFLAVVGMGDGLVLMCVKSPNIYHHLPVVHPVDSLQGNHESRQRSRGISANRLYGCGQCLVLSK